MKECNNYDAIGNVAANLIERYGITLCEIPIRFKQKIIEAIPSLNKDSLDRFFFPLEQGLLTPIRRKTNEYLDPSDIEDAALNISEQLPCDSDEALGLTINWVNAMGIKSSLNIDVAKPVNSNESTTRNTDFTSSTTNKKLNEIGSSKSNLGDMTEEFGSYSKAYGDDELADILDLTPLGTQNIKQAESTRKAEENKSKRESSKKKINVQQRANTYKEKITPPPPPMNRSSNKPKVSKNNIADDKETIVAAFKYRSKGNHDKAAKIMMRLAKSGNKVAQFHLGEFYLAGTGVDVNEEKAKYWLNKSSKNGFGRATEKLEELTREEDEGSGCCGCIVILFAVIFAFIWLISFFQ